MSNPSDKTIELLERIRQINDAYKGSEVFELLSDEVLQQAGSWELYLERALANHRVKLFDFSIRDCDSALAINPDATSVIQAKCNAVIGQVRFSTELLLFDKAAKEIELVKNKIPDTEEFRGLIAETYELWGDHILEKKNELGAAEKYITSMNYATFDNQLRLARKISKIYIDASMFKEAIELLQIYPALYRELARVHILRARIAHRKNMFEKAFTDLLSASKVQPDNFEAYLLRGRMLLELEKYSDAIVAFTKCVEIKADLNYLRTIIGIIQEKLVSGCVTSCQLNKSPTVFILPGGNQWMQRILARQFSADDQYWKIMVSGSAETIIDNLATYTPNILVLHNHDESHNYEKIQLLTILSRKLIPDCCIVLTTNEFWVKEKYTDNYEFDYLIMADKIAELTREIALLNQKADSTIDREYFAGLLKRLSVL